jgi:hypothetical protein
MIKKPKEYRNPFGTVAEQIAKAKAERVQRAAFYAETHEIVSRAIDLATDFRDINGDRVTGTAHRILLAGMRRRGEIAVDGTLPEPGSLAAKIILAGKRRRGEVE